MGGCGLNAVEPRANAKPSSDNERLVLGSGEDGVNVHLWVMASQLGPDLLTRQSHVARTPGMHDNSLSASACQFDFSVQRHCRIVQNTSFQRFYKHLGSETLHLCTAAPNGDVPWTIKKRQQTTRQP
jgi:hypothetical protein